MLPNLWLRKSSFRFRRVTVTVISLLISFSFWYFIDSFFSVKTIVIEGLKKNEALVGLNDFASQSLIVLSEKKVEKDVKAKNPQVKTVSLQKIYPQTIKIRLNLYEPVAAVTANYGYFYLSEDGRILGKNREKNTNLPVINYYQKIDYYSYPVGDWIRYKDILIALNFLKNPFIEEAKVDSIDINGNNVILFNLNEKKIYFSTEKEVEIQNYEIEQIIRQFKVEGKEFKSLDLRFDKPIIKF